MPSIKIPTPLREYTDSESQVEVNGQTVQEALANLLEQYPELEQHIYKDGELRSFVNIFIGDEDIRFLQGVDTEINDDDRLRIIPSIAGGY
jgi:adenylyltransferase/sulfurtransferase